MVCKSLTLSFGCTRVPWSTCAAPDTLSANLLFQKAYAHVFRPCLHAALHVSLSQVLPPAALYASVIQPQVIQHTGGFMSACFSAFTGSATPEHRKNLLRSIFSPQQGVWYIMIICVHPADVCQSSAFTSAIMGMDGSAPLRDAAMPAATEATFSPLAASP